MNVVLALYLICAMAYFVWVARDLTTEKIEEMLNGCPDQWLGFCVFLIFVIFIGLALLWPISLGYDMWTSMRKESRP